MHLDASCRRLQSLFKPSLLHWQKMSNVVKMRRESRAANRARMNAAGVNPMIIFASAMMGMKPFLSNKEHLTSN